VSGSEIEPDTPAAGATTPAPAPAAGGRAAMLVGAGILLSRILGFVRQRIFAHFLGLTSDAADALSAAFRIPNLLQNLFGEGALSASFIPVYAGLRARGEDDRARVVAQAVLGLLSVVTAVIVLLGVLAAPLLVATIAPGFEGEKHELTVRLVQIIFPGVGVLVLSAWCLGILNSHRRFFLAYVAPVAWNLAIIAAPFLVRPQSARHAAMVLAAGAVVGSVLQFGVQLPLVWKLLGTLRPTLDVAGAEVRRVLRNFAPAAIGRGVVQLSGYVDEMLASLLPTGAVAAQTYALNLYMLPVSLFGIAVSAAELPGMSSEAAAGEAAYARLRERLEAGLRRIAFFVVPSAAAFIAFGDLIAGALFETGRFSARDSDYVWGVLAAYSVGLLATTMARLYASTFYALGDTRTPLRFALLRVAGSAALGYVAALHLPGWLGVDRRWGVAGIALATALAGTWEYTRLRRAVQARVGPVRSGARQVLPLVAAAAGAVALGWGVRMLVDVLHPLAAAPIVLVAFGGTYLALAALLVPETRVLAAGIGRRLRGRR
jgi:putative peptidoglycan lipid II flippase